MEKDHRYKILVLANDCQDLDVYLDKVGDATGYFLIFKS